MFTYRLTLFNFVIVFAATTLLHYACETSALERSILHISPPTLLHRDLQGRDEIPHEPTLDVGKLNEFVKRSTSDEQVGCHVNNIVVRSLTNRSEVANEGESVGKVVKKKTVIGTGSGDAHMEKPVKRVMNAVGGARGTLVTGKASKKTLDKSSLSGLIQAMKTKALSSLLGRLNSKTGARKSETESPKTKLEKFLSGATALSTSTGSEENKTKPDAGSASAVKSTSDNILGKNAIVGDAGKSILAAIDDKEGLRAALAKAIDRVEKVVANKNGALALAAKKIAENKSLGVSRSTTELGNTTVSLNSTTSSKNSTETRSLNSTSTANASTSSPTPEPPAVKDPYAEIALGPDKPKIPELKGEEDTAATSTTGGVMKMGTDGNSADINPAAVAAAAGGDAKPSSLHDVGGLLDRLTDKVNLQDTKGIADGGPGLPDSVSSILDHAQDKLNGMGDQDMLGGNGGPLPDNEVKYMQSQLAENNNNEDPTAGGKMDPNDPNGGMQAASKMASPDELALKAMAGGGGDDMPGSSRHEMGHEMKHLEKDDVFNSMLKNQGTMNEEEMNHHGDMGDGDGDGSDMQHMGVGQMRPMGDGDMRHMSGHMNKNNDDDNEDNGPMNHSKDPDSSESLVKDILDKAGSMNSMSPKAGGGGGGSDDNFKDGFQGADITAGPDPYENDKSGNGDAFGAGAGMFGAGAGGGGKGNVDELFNEPQNGRMGGQSMQGFSQGQNTGGPEDSFGGGDGNGGPGPGPGEDSFGGPPRESIESNEDQQMPGRSMDGGSRGLDSYLNMANVNPMGTDAFQTRQVIPEHRWRHQPVGGYHDNYNAQIFKKNVIMRPQKDAYESPFKDKSSYDVEQ